MRITEYRTNKDYEFGNMMDPSTLPAGSFVKPISDIYVPKHVKQSSVGAFHLKGRDVFCYTRLGMVSIPWSYLSEV